MTGKSIILSLEGASVTIIDPEMDSEPLNSRDVKYSYFREIEPGETQTVIFHMRAATVLCVKAVVVLG